ncbi:MAG TPA: lytic transglycosylase domain-containing protein [Acidobacteriaceae bacterium]
MLAAGAMPVRALERMTLRDGATWDCVRHESAGDRVRVYTNEESYIEIKAADIVSVDVLSAPVAAKPVEQIAVKASAGDSARLSKADLNEMLASAGQQHNIDADLLASIVMAESGGQPKAVSRTGAKGLMQLMPGTAREMNVADSFVPQQNIAGGTQYLDAMLTRYHDDIAKAVAAYNAGPGAVDRYHGVPPYRETRMYVARVIREFNRRKTAVLHERRATLAMAIPELK